MSEDSVKHPETAAIFSRLLEELEMSGNQFAKSLQAGISQQVISNYASGKNKPGQEIFATIIRKYPHLNAAWLITGEGEPFPNGKFGEKAPKEGFFPNTRINHMGVSVGEIPDIDMSDTAGSPTASIAGQTDKEFRDMLIKQLGKYKEQLASKDVENSKLHRIIEQLQQTIDFLQDQLSEALSELRGKSEGNQLDAPGLYIPEVPRNTVGFALNRKPEAKLIAMYPYGVPTHEPVLMRA